MTDEAVQVVVGEPEAGGAIDAEAITRAAVVRFDAARSALAKATKVEEVNAEMDKAQTFRDWAARRGASLDVLNDASEYKLDCERRAGELLMNGEMVQKRGRPVAGSQLETLETLGITKNDSSRWQRVSIVDEETYRAWCRELRARSLEITTIGLLKLAKSIKTQEMRAQLAEETARLQEAMEDDDAVIYDLSRAERLFGQVRSFYVDPPWRYDDSTITGAAELQYPTMSVEDICAMGNSIKQLAHGDGSFLWLWTTWPMIRDGAPQKVIEAWGFSWKSEMVWNKMRMGMGRWLRGQTEVCILATRGAPKRMRDDLAGYFESVSGRHSEKPVVMYEMVETFGAGEYLELFHRGTRRPGWNVFGNADSTQDGAEKAAEI